tara:strand:- start:2680 stop:3750 length:1071 start_codon:yes stop_codon:yes gene_type:complete
MKEVESKLLLEPGDFTPSHRGWQITGVLNPGAVRMADGKICLYVRVAESAGSSKTNVCPQIVHKGGKQMTYEKFHKNQVAAKEDRYVVLQSGDCRLTNISHFRRVILEKNGFDLHKIEDKVAFMGQPNDGDYGVEDPRIVCIKGEYYMTYVGVSSKNGVSTYLTRSKDLKKWEDRQLIFREMNKDAALFPAKIKGKYVAFHRPEPNFSTYRPSIWIAYSPDLIYWGREKAFIRPRKDSWESERVGAGAPPLRTKKGWLVIYHGVESVKGKNGYSVGALLLDLKNPEKIIARTSKKKPLLVPQGDHEKKGFVDNVIFPTGAVFTEDKKSILLYSGAADKYVTVRRVPLEMIWRNLKV